eukprot:TRINITY_DN29136_c0_g1_i1.p1 TRINITY_DN29136_c0_g1~~TRINITY_DN29136_c0_g1_i1.p1  ORF type:complete len:729 (+),score=75.57 TRINITY_DN29136_c0_g1_i1:153-2339(+)
MRRGYGIRSLRCVTQPMRGLIGLMSVVLFRIASIPVVYAATYIENRMTCNPERDEKWTYGNVTSLPPSQMAPCLTLPIHELLGANKEVGVISHKSISDTVELVMIIEKYGSVQYLEVITDGDSAYWDVARKPKVAFRTHSCLNRDEFCGVISVMPTYDGFTAIDRHRLRRFSFTWLPEKDYEKTDYGMAKCGNGQEIVTEEECILAVSKLLITSNQEATGESWFGEDSNYPCDCSIGKESMNRNAHINMRSSKCRTHPDLAPVCVKVDDNPQVITEVVENTFGKFNTEADDPTGRDSLLFPTEVAEYMPFDLTHFSGPSSRPVEAPGYYLGKEITPAFPSSFHLSQQGIMPRFFFVTDTGNHRLVVLNATGQAQLDFIMQFGVTGVPLKGKQGFDWPLGVAVHRSCENSVLVPCVANIYVTDFRNDRLVKLDLMDLAAGFTLVYSCDYGSDQDTKGRQRGLRGPVSVSLFEQYIFVGEAGGNAITVLMLDYRTSRKINFVTHMQPAVGIRLTGHLVVSSPRGYIWFVQVMDGDTYALGTLYLPESLRRSIRPTLLNDFKQKCVNKTWYNTFRVNTTLYYAHMRYALKIAQINFEFEEWRSGGVEEDDEIAFVEILSYNLTDSFDFNKFNRTVFNGKMKICLPPPPASKPPDDVWKQGRLASRRRQSRPRQRRVAARGLLRREVCGVDGHRLEHAGGDRSHRLWHARQDFLVVGTQMIRMSRAKASAFH